MDVEVNVNVKWKIKQMYIVDFYTNEIFLKSHTFSHCKLFLVKINNGSNMILVLYYIQSIVDFKRSKLYFQIVLSKQRTKKCKIHRRRPLQFAAPHLQIITLPGILPTS